MEDTQNGMPMTEPVQEPVPTTTAPVDTPDVQTAPQGDDTDEPAFGIDENGDITFADAFFGEPTGDYDDDPEPAQDQPQDVPQPQPEMQTVRVDGQDVQVSMDEMRNGYMRQADLTK